MRRRLLLIIALAAPSAAAVSRAHAQPTIHAGSRVRVEAPGIAGRRLEGTLTAANADSLTISVGDGPSPRSATMLTVPMSAVRRVDIQAGRSRGRGAIRGALIGTVLGLGFAAATNAARNSDIRNASDSISSAAYAAGGVIVFGGAGALLGGAIGVERWVRLGPPVRVSVVPRADGGMVRVSVARRRRRG